MSSSRWCEHCGQRLPSRAPGGLCPRCLLAAASRPAPESTDGSSAPPEEALAVPYSPRAGTVRFEDYELLNKVAEGGMGVVYRARQLSLNRIVALKMIQPGRVGSPETVLRFRAEAEAAASLHHPNIVAIHETGEYEGQHFFSMDYIEGMNLAEAVREGPLAAARAAQIMEKIATAVQYAHEHGILHRDLKPSNVILDETGEPQVSDFGLARRLGSASTLTLTGQVFGSPGFMPPEQAAGRPGAIGVHSDVYGLGAILYHLLTGRAPFVDETVETTLAQVIEQEPVPPRLLNASTPRDLDTICLKCLQKHPPRRYPTSRAVADELRRFLNHEPILARPAGPADKLWRWCQRKPALAGLSAALFAALLMGAGAVLWQWHQTRIANAAAQSREYAANIALAQSLISGKQFDRARQILNELVREQDRGWEWGWLQRQCNQDLMTLPGAGNMFALFSPDSRCVATGGGNTNAISIWDLNSGARARLLAGQGYMTGHASFNPDGQQLAAPGWYDPNVWIWSVGDARQVTNLAHPSGVFNASYSPDGKRLATTCWDGHVRLWDTANWKLLLMSPDYGDEVYCAEFSPDGRRVAYAGGYYKWGNSRNTAVYLWDWASGEVRRVQGEPHRQCVSGLAWSPDGQLIASAGWEGQIKIVDTVSARELAAIEPMAGEAGIVSIAFSPDGRSLAVAGAGFPLDTARLEIFNVSKRCLTRELLGHVRTGTGISFSPNGQYIATAAFDNDVKIWSAQPRSTYLSLIGHDQPVWTAAFSPDGKFLATGSLDQTAKIWNPTNGALLQTIAVRFPVVSLAFNPGSDRLVTVGPDNGACVWAVEPGKPPPEKERLRLVGHTRAVTAVAWSPDGRWIATGGKDGKVILWDAAAGRSCRTWTNHAHRVFALAFAPQNKLLATGGADQTVRVWDIQSGDCVRILSNNSGKFAALAFAPDGSLLASGADNGQASLWETRSWRQLGPLTVSSSRAGVIAFSPDGRRLVTSPSYTDLCASDKRESRITLCDLSSGQELLGLLAHTNAVYGVAFSPDGRRLVTTSSDNTARIWEAFPYSSKDYPGDSQTPLPTRIEQLKRQFARKWFQASPPPGRRLASRFGNFNLPPAGSKTRPRFPLPSRSLQASRLQLDLSPECNVALNESWEPLDDAYELDRNLAALGAGNKTLAGVAFEVQGLIQLRRIAPDCEQFPEAVSIAVGQRFRQFHALHGTRWLVAEDTPVAAFILHYDDGSQHELPVLYGQHFRVENVNASLQYGFGPGCSEAVVAWTGPPAAEPGGWQPRLYLATFENPYPEREVRTIEYVSKLTQSAPFLLALTVE